MAQQPTQQSVIETPRLLLRGVKPSDVTDLHECFRDAEVMRYWSELPHPTTERTQEWVDAMFKSKNNGVTDFVIVLKSSTPPSHTNGVNGVNDEREDYESMGEKVIGKVGIWQGNEIGFLLGRMYWGQGLASEAITPIIDLGFRLGLDEADAEVNGEDVDTPKNVIADVDPRNTASLGILKKFGFEVYSTRERTFQIGDLWVDSVYLRLRREVWMQKRLEIRERIGGKTW